MMAVSVACVESLFRAEGSPFYMILKFKRFNSKLKYKNFKLTNEQANKTY